MTTLRMALKVAAAGAVFRTGADRMLSALMVPAGEPLVLGYHRVVEDYPRHAAHTLPAMLVSTRTLEQQLEEVGRRFRFVSLDELGEQLASGAQTDRPLAAVTFDDGYRDVYEHAFPLLQRQGIPSAVFVVTGQVGSDRRLAHDRLYGLVARALLEPGCGPAGLARILEGRGWRAEALRAGSGRGAFAVTRALLEALSSSDLEGLMEGLAAAVGPEREADRLELQPLSWEMVRRMHRAGVVVGSHTRSHAVLTHEEGVRIRQEVAGSRQTLEAELGAPVRHFAYPDGGFHAGVIDEVARAGYAFAYTTCRHRDRRRPHLTVPRRLWWEGSCHGGRARFSPSMMRGQVRGLFDLCGRCRQDHGPAALRPRQSAV